MRCPSDLKVAGQKPKSLCTVTNATFEWLSGDGFSYFRIPGLPSSLVIPIVVNVAKETVGTLYYTGVCWVFEPDEAQGDVIYRGALEGGRGEVMATLSQRLDDILAMLEAGIGDRQLLIEEAASALRHARVEAQRMEERLAVLEARDGHDDQA